MLVFEEVYFLLPDLSAVERALLSSPGYQAYQNESMRLNRYEQELLLKFSQYSFWANRNASVEARKNFDEQYGLV